jgi:hypothetical protein
MIYLGGLMMAFNFLVNKFHSIPQRRTLLGLIAVFYFSVLTATTYAAPAPPTIYLQPQSLILGPNSSFSVEVHENSGTTAVNAVQANFSYPANLVDFVSIDSTGSAFGVQAQATGGNGSVAIARGSTTPLTGDKLVSKVNFKTKATSANAAMSFVGGTALVSSSTNKNLLSSLSVTAGGSYTIDATKPTVTLTAPVAGSTVSGASVVLSANASDNLGVAGVQFKIDGKNVGVEDTAAPYSVAWNSKYIVDGSHTITATARDRAGNSTTSVPVSIAVANGTSSFVQVVEAQSGSYKSCATSQPRSDTKAVGGSALALACNNNYSQYTFKAPVNGSFDLGATMKSQDYNGSAKADIYVDNTKVVAAQSISSSGYAFYKATETFNAGSSHTIKVVFINDAYGGTSITDRNLWVDQFKLILH